MFNRGKWLTAGLLAAGFVGSVYAMADVTVVNDLSSADTVTVNNQVVGSGSSKAMGLNIFNGDARVTVCDDQGQCKHFKVQDTHQSCTSGSWYYLINQHAWYLDLYVNDHKKGHLCTVMKPNAGGDLIVHVRLHLEKNDAAGYSYRATYEDMLGDEKETFIW